jgi:hypothetical protein
MSSRSPWGAYGEAKYTGSARSSASTTRRTSSGWTRTSALIPQSRRARPLVGVHHDLHDSLAGDDDVHGELELDAAPGPIRWVIERTVSVACGAASLGVLNVSRVISLSFQTLPVVWPTPVPSRNKVNEE